MIESMGARYPRPDWLRRMNAMEASVGGAGELVSLDVDNLISSACATTGLERFGDFDGDWRGRLDSLVAEIEASASLGVMGRPRQGRVAPSGLSCQNDTYRLC